MSWTLQTQQDLRFITRVIEAKKIRQRFNLVLNTKELPESDIAELAVALQDSNMIEFCLSRTRKAPHFNVSSILRCLYHIETLRRLEIRFKLMPDEVEPLARAVQNPHLNEIGFSEVALPEIWPLLIPIVSLHPSLSTFNVKMDLVSAPEALKDILAINTSIRTLTLTLDVEHTIDSISKICAGLRNNSTLESLRLPKATSDAMDVLSKTFAHNGTKIKALQIRYPVTTRNIEILAEALSTNTMLHTLELNCTLDPCQFLFKGLPKNSSLKHLKFFYSDFLEETMEGVRALCDCLKQNTSLETIEMDCLCINDEHCALLADMLTVNKTLKTLLLEGNKFTDKGQKSLFTALTKNSSLTHLNVSNAAGISSESLTCVKELFTLNTTLESLSLTMPKSGVFCDVVLEGLQQNSTLRHMFVDQPEYDELEIDQLEYEAKIVKVLERNFALEKVCLWAMSDDSSPEISRLLQRNIRMKSDMKYKVAVLSHNIARSKENFFVLPCEIWLAILSSVVHPGMPSFGALVQSVFAKYV